MNNYKARDNIHIVQMYYLILSLVSIVLNNYLCILILYNASYSIIIDKHFNMDRINRHIHRVYIAGKYENLFV